MFTEGGQTRKHCVPATFDERRKQDNNGRSMCSIYSLGVDNYVLSDDESEDESEDEYDEIMVINLGMTLVIITSQQLKKQMQAPPQTPQPHGVCQRFPTFPTLLTNLVSLLCNQLKAI